MKLAYLRYSETTKMNMRKIALAACFALLGTLLLTSTGCSSSKEEITTDYLRGDVYPELTTLIDTKDQRKSRKSKAISTNMHGMANDWDNFWFLDKPLEINRVLWR